MTVNFTFYEFKRFNDGKIFNSNCKLISLIDKKKPENHDDLTKFAISKNDEDKYYLIFYTHYLLLLLLLLILLIHHLLLQM